MVSRKLAEGRRRFFRFVSGKGTCGRPHSPTERRTRAGLRGLRNDYDKAFEVKAGGATHIFDSFECAIHALAPSCALWLPGDRPRGRGGRPHPSLRPLRRRGRRG